MLLLTFLLALCWWLAVGPSAGFIWEGLRPICAFLPSRFTAAHSRRMRFRRLPRGRQRSTWLVLCSLTLAGATEQLALIDDMDRACRVQCLEEHGEHACPPSCHACSCTHVVGLATLNLVALFSAVCPLDRSEITPEAGELPPTPPLTDIYRPPIV